ncbi:MAG: tryptophan--tRNA ligase, partial [Candidatus Micrarchaeia archaeon]
MGINPWGSEIVQAEKLFEEFGLKPISNELRDRFKEYYIFSRGIIIAHRDFDRFVVEYEKGKQVAVMSGIKPTGPFHMGSLLTAAELTILQKMFGAKVFYSIADLEAYADNGQSYENSEAFAIDNVADLLACGLDEKNAYIYRQSREMRVIQLANIFATHTTRATMEAIYGERHMGLYMCAMVQMGDIYLPQHNDFGYEQVVVPVGLDQDPHIRLARDLAYKEHRLKLNPPSAIYHKTILSLDGQTKMSKRNPDSMLMLNENEQTLKRKLGNAFTGGRESIEEQRKLGGRAEICPIYHLGFNMFDMDDKRNSERWDRCYGGKLLCGECKKEMFEIIIDWMRKHKELKDEKMHIAKEIVK